MRLQKLKHSMNDIIGLEKDTIIVHGVNEIELGGEFTICGRAIPDSNIRTEGWERVEESFKGRIKDCDCRSCLNIIAYYKSLR